MQLEAGTFHGDRPQRKEQPLKIVLSTSILALTLVIAAAAQDPFPICTKCNDGNKGNIVSMSAVAQTVHTAFAETRAQPFLAYVKAERSQITTKQRNARLNLSRE